MIVTLEDLAKCLGLNKHTVRNYFNNYQLLRFYNDYSKTIDLNSECIKEFEKYLGYRSNFYKVKQALTKFRALITSLKISV